MFIFCKQAKWNQIELTGKYLTEFQIGHNFIAINDHLY